MTSRKNQKEIK